MALVKCPECGKQISDQAAACPQCGLPSKRTKAQAASQVTKVKRSGGAAEALGFVLIVAGMFVGMAANGTVGGFLAIAGFVTFLAGRFS